VVGVLLVAGWEGAVEGAACLVEVEALGVVLFFYDEELLFDAEAE
jgi:hypothetical protein